MSLRVSAGVQMTVCTVALALLTGCVSANEVESLRAAEVKSAFMQAQLECQMDTGLPPASEIVQTCIRRLEPAMFDQAVAEDRAELQASGTMAMPPAEAAPDMQPPLHAAAPPYAPASAPTPAPAPCAMMGCPSPAAQQPQFIPYTPGGGNPSGYGLLSQ